MKIRDRLALQFSLIFAVLLLLVLGSIYLTTEKNRKSDFDKRLHDRALTVAELFLAEDNLTKEKFREVQIKYPLNLPGEILGIYNSKHEAVFIKQQEPLWPDKIIALTELNKEISYATGNRQTVGIKYFDNSGNFVVLISAVDEQGFKRMHVLLQNMIFIFFASVILMFFMGQLFARNALRPIRKIIDDVKYIRATSLNKRLTYNNSKDEIHDLILTFNNLLEHIEQSFEAQGSFIANASHELRTPMTAIIGEIEVILSQNRQVEEYKEALKNVLAETEKLNELINNLFELAQTNIDLRPEEISLDELLWQVKDEWSNKIPNSDIELKYSQQIQNGGAIINGNRQLLFVAFGNLVNNAIKFSNNQKVIISLYKQNNGIFISIIDQGIGIPPEERVKLFTPFKRASNSTGFPGFGIGLSLTLKILKLHNAEIEINQKKLNGTEFIISFEN